jgi:hypothetical protein
MPKLPSERKRPRIGDVIEIATPAGVAYAQYTHEHRDPPRYGSLLRILPGLYETPPHVTALVQQEERFRVFFPLGAALNRGIFRIVANEDVPLSKQAFPLFRSRTVVKDVGAGPWYMWDGTREWRARKRERGTPRALHEVWNDTLLIERIASGWSPPEEE